MMTIRGTLLTACLLATHALAELAETGHDSHDHHAQDDESLAPARGVRNWVSPEYKWLYQFELPVPPMKQPLKVIQNPITGKDIWYYEVEIKPFSRTVYPDLGPAHFIGYDGTSPGSTFYVEIGTETVVRFVNNGPVDSSVHLHGSPSRPPFDGWAADITRPGEYKDYYWPNFQAGQSMWYHDHALMQTAENVNFGLAGAFWLHGPQANSLNLPSGYGEYDFPIILSAKYYNQDGSLKTTLGEDVSVWGDVIEVNGQPWPYLEVEPRKYRLRLLNAAISRDWNLYFVDAGLKRSRRIPFQVVSSDSGLLGEPVTTSDIYIGIAERYSIVVDFSEYAGRTIDMRNVLESNGVGADKEYPHTDKVMRFRVKPNPVQDTSVVPAFLRELLPRPASTGEIRRFRFHKRDGVYLINGVGFADVNNRVLAKPTNGRVETWVLENNSNGWTHPVHIHLVDFRVVARSGGRNKVEPYESAGYKDVVWLGKGETVTVEAYFLPWTGLYMFHCHNLIHEDNDMMDAFNVTQLEGLGYNEKTDYSDPMDPRWRAVPFRIADFTARSGDFSDAAITAKVQKLAREEPYSQLDEALEVLIPVYEEQQGLQ